jgi:hypothetical protein
MSACWKEGELRAFLDGELPAESLAAIRTHLEECAACHARVTRLEVTRSWADEQLVVTRREGDAVPPLAARAYARLQERLETQTNWKERIQIMSEGKQFRWRPVLIALALVALVAASFTLEPVRALAGDFLSIFRVRSFAVVPLGPEQMERVEEIGALLEQNLILGDMVSIEEPKESVVDSAEEASAAAGFQVRTLTAVPEEFVALPGYTVTSQASGQVNIDLEMARSLFEMVDLDPALLPNSLGAEPLNVSIEPLVTQVWAYQARGDLVFIQGPSPSVDFPDDVDPVALARAAFQLLGMSEREARRLSESIDWTSTLAVPVPTDIASFSEVEVDGVTGLLLTQQSNRGRPGSALMWQKGGILYFIQGRLMSDDMMELAESIR